MKNVHATLSNRAFRSVAAFTSACVFGAVWFWDGGVEGAAAPGDGATLPCTAPYIHDGDNIRCREIGRGRLYGIDAPEMPGACRRGRSCTPGDPYASRDHLRSLVASRAVRCRKVETDHYGRAILQCWAGNMNLSCAQVQAGHAVKRYGWLSCG